MRRLHPRFSALLTVCLLALAQPAAGLPHVECADGYPCAGSPHQPVKNGKACCATNHTGSPATAATIKAAPMRCVVVAGQAQGIEQVRAAAPRPLMLAYQSLAIPVLPVPVASGALSAEDSSKPHV